MKKNEGITLVALVITIIVLLILAGVSISLVVGDNGVLTQSQNAAKDTNAANAQSAVELTAASLNSQFMGENWKNNRTAKIYDTYKFSDFEAELVKNGYEIVNHESIDNNYIDNTVASGTPNGSKVIFEIQKTGVDSTKTTTKWKFELSFNDKGTQIMVKKLDS